MATWDGLGKAATVAQLVGFDALGLISKIRQAARTARQNSSDCEHLAHRADMLAALLPRLRHDDPDARRLLAGLGDALAEAHDLVVSCHGRGRTYRLLTAGRIADRFRDVDRKIDSYLQVFPVLTHISVDRLLPVNATSAMSPPPPSPRSREEPGDGEEFTLAEITVATDNFAVVLSDDGGDAGTTVYRGRLHDGREVAVKRLKPAGGRRGAGAADDAFGTELAILAPLRHSHIVRLVGWCAEDGERLVITELTGSGSLHDHLHGRTTKPSSPVAASWKVRVEVLLGAARGVEHLHRRAVPLVIHGGVTSSTILLDAVPTWAPRLSGFGAAVWRAAGVDSQPVDTAAFASAAARGYADPELLSTGRIRPASDVYSLGVVMLEVLTGKPPAVTVWDEATGSVASMTLVSFALPSIRAGRLVDVLDPRPAPEATTAWQLEPLQMVANTAARCLWLHGDNRPAISEVVADLEQALQLICRRGHF